MSALFLQVVKLFEEQEVHFISIDGIVHQISVQIGLKNITETKEIDFYWRGLLTIWKLIIFKYSFGFPS